MPSVITKMLESNSLWVIARLLVLVLFISSGLAKVFDYENSLAEMRAAGLHPDWFQYCFCCCHVNWLCSCAI